MMVGCGGPEPRDLETLERVDGVYMNPSDGQPYSGPVFRMRRVSRRDVQVMTWSLKDGERDGPYETYYNNSQLKQKGTRKDGVWDGPYEEYENE